MKTRSLILLIEDDLPMRKYLRLFLTAKDYGLIEAGTIKEGLELAAKTKPDLILLDLSQTEVVNTRTLSEIRESSSAPVIILSSQDNAKEKVTLLFAGADDFISKPFNPEELHARIQVSLRRCLTSLANAHDTVIAFDNISIDLQSHSLYIDGKNVHLTPTEYRLLKCLALSPDRAISFKSLFNEIQQDEIHGDPKAYLRVYIMQLRKKIEPIPAKPKYIMAVPSHGYILQTRRQS